MSRTNQKAKRRRRRKKRNSPRIFVRDSERPRVPEPYVQLRNIQERGGGYPCRGIAANLMETADSTSTLHNSLQPSRPCRKYQEYPRAYVATRQSNSGQRPSNRRAWKFRMEIHPSNPRFFFFSVSRVAACFYVSSGLCQTPYGVITHPIKQHAIDHSGTATRNSESQTIEFVAPFRCHRFQRTLSFLEERLIYFFFLFHRSMTNIELLLRLTVRDSKTCCHSTRKRHVTFGTKRPCKAWYFIFTCTFFFHRKYRIIRFFIQNTRLINPSL